MVPRQITLAISPPPIEAPLFVRGLPPVACLTRSGNRFMPQATGQGTPCLKSRPYQSKDAVEEDISTTI
jgi:hypothetical protein